MLLAQINNILRKKVSEEGIKNPITVDDFEVNLDLSENDICVNRETLQF